MAKPKPVDVIMSALEPFLDELSDQWDAQPESQRRPTLPQTIDGKVNVTEIVRLLQRRNPAIKMNYVQYFHRKTPQGASNGLTTLVNIIAELQGLKPIGARAVDAEAFDRLTARLESVQAQANKTTQAAVDREYLIAQLRQENDSLRAQLRMIEETGMPMRMREVR
jgi:hypothetical protein